MRILFLTQIIPYPPDAGPKVKTWHVLRYLVERGHEVILASFVRPEELPHLPVLQKLCAQVHVVPIRRSRAADVGYMLRSFVSGRPFLIERDDLAGMRALVARLLAEKPVDVIHADQLTMTQFAFPQRDLRQAPSPEEGLPGQIHAGNGSKPSPRRPNLIFDAHNAVWTIVNRSIPNAAWFLRPVLRIEAQRIKQYEGLLLQKFHHTLTVAEPDRFSLLEAAAATGLDTTAADDRLTVIPIAVDSEALQPIRTRPGSNNIVTLGTLHYPPNADGIRWFFNEVYPLVRQQVPQATLTIIGKNPPRDFLQLAESQPEAVKVTGYVPDLTPYLEEAALMVVPVRAGGGMRVRILEAFARGMPVVTTTVGLEGIQARVNEDVLVNDSPSGFATAVVRLLHDQKLRARLADNGRRLAETRYDWQVVLRQMDQVYQSIADQRREEAVKIAHPS
jgi:glycosyltransferase involved in cell wall biosynthesis